MGCAVPQEFGWYDNNPRIESIDTSNPIMAALEGIVYTQRGLTVKPKANMNDFFDVKIEDIDYNKVTVNTNVFRLINGLKPLKS